MPIPEFGTSEYENMIQFMREDLESGGAYTKLILAAKKAIEAQGKNFDQEFEKWMKKKKQKNIK